MNHFKYKDFFFLPTYEANVFREQWRRKHIASLDWSGRPYPITHSTSVPTSVTLYRINICRNYSKLHFKHNLIFHPLAISTEICSRTRYKKRIPKYLRYSCKFWKYPLIKHSRGNRSNLVSGCKATAFSATSRERRLSLSGAAADSP